MYFLTAAVYFNYDDFEQSVVKLLCLLGYANASCQGCIGELWIVLFNDVQVASMVS